MMDSSERILMVTGAYPPEICGVGDYTHRLMAAAPASWELFEAPDWSWSSGPKIVRRLLGRRPDAIVIQYPTQGYGWSLVPHLLALVGRITGRYRTVLALHEFTSLSRKAQLALALAAKAAAHIIFTTEVERDRALASRLFPTSVPTSVVAILSNIPWTTDPPPFFARSIDIAYFGHIRPNKGLEEFLDVAGAVRRLEPTVRIAIIGEVPRGYEAYGDMVAARCKAIGVALTTGLDDEAAGRMLADVRILYLPFRDGVSARRGTALAGLGNGAIVATRIGTATPPAMRRAVIACTGTIEDVPVLKTALNMPAADAAAQQQAGYDYIAAALPRGWAHVVALYEIAIAGVLGRPADGG